ncbi:S-adenosyl-L-methionine-dependent methyltransferase [Trichodelitschia bisporula]|uniref:S-adenosyl-L-methionine-dependent methyltransferase n=1 Tax=Trichodelitschia bisporula TaxID=703511 RepID=A0A6G1IBF8_9PEZI|nr:S-adenosyl-L-methionine-dependent methyltransferase [Trichodelitschia bisporula]
MSRPEDILPPDLYYNEPTSKKYTTNSRIRTIQASMTHRALSLLSLTTPSLVLDIGAGSGLSGQILSSVPTSAGGPHTWIGLDISASMLAVALEREVEGDLLLADAGQGLGFRAGTFDAAISISAVQWLCNAESSEETAPQRLKRFFDSLYVSLKRGGRAVCQFYPRDERQKKMVADAAIRAGFGAGLLEDGAGTKGVKVYLVLTAGETGDITGVVEGMEGVEVDDHRKKRQKGEVASRKDDILRRKARLERKGKVVKATSKYTGRKRKIAF